MKKSLSLLGAIFAGILIPQASQFSYLIYYLLFFMLFMPFLNAKVCLKTFKRKEVYFVLIANIAIGILGYILLKDYYSDLALIALIVGITPTATASPAVMRYLKGNVNFAIATVVVTNIVISCILPFIFRFISDIEIPVYTLLIQISGIILGPLILGQSIYHFLPQIRTKLLKLKEFGFYAWLMVCFIAVAKASDFVKNSETDTSLILIIAGISAIICFVNFGLGAQLGGKDLKLETSQTLGQKNTTLTIWIAITYFSPLIALGPIFYLIWHNFYNAYQLATQASKK